MIPRTKGRERKKWRLGGRELFGTGKYKQPRAKAKGKPTAKEKPKELMQRVDLGSRPTLRRERGQREHRCPGCVGRWLMRQRFHPKSRVQMGPKQEGKGSFSRDQIAWFCA